VVETDMVYFSFVTLATLGYGDIVPLSSLARSIAVTEALIGQFYVAVVVALLIGAYLSSRQSADGRSSPASSQSCSTE
jgi:voltage-gated potassium channel Kch